MQSHQDKADDARETRNWISFILAAQGVILLVLVVLALNYPVVSQ